MEINKQALKKLNDRVTKAIENIIKRKKGGKNNKPAKRRTGKLLQTEAVIDFDGTEFTFNLDAYDHYTYLDKGSKRIKKPFEYTEEIINSKEVNQAIEEFLIDHFKQNIEKQWQ